SGLRDVGGNASPIAPAASCELKHLGLGTVAKLGCHPNDPVSTPGSSKETEAPGSGCRARHQIRLSPKGSLSPMTAKSNGKPLTIADLDDNKALRADL